MEGAGAGAGAATILVRVRLKGAEAGADRVQCTRTAPATIPLFSLAIWLISAVFLLSDYGGCGWVYHIPYLTLFTPLLPLPPFFFTSPPLYTPYYTL